MGPYTIKPLICFHNIYSRVHICSIDWFTKFEWFYRLSDESDFSGALWLRYDSFKNGLKTRRLGRNIVALSTEKSLLDVLLCCPDHCCYPGYCLVLCQDYCQNQQLGLDLTPFLQFCPFCSHFCSSWNPKHTVNISDKCIYISWSTWHKTDKEWHW